MGFFLTVIWRCFPPAGLNKFKKREKVISLFIHEHWYYRVCLFFASVCTNSALTSNVNLADEQSVENISIFHPFKKAAVDHSLISNIQSDILFCMINNIIKHSCRSSTRVRFHVVHELGCFVLRKSCDSCRMHGPREGKAHTHTSDHTLLSQHAPRQRSRRSFQSSPDPGFQSNDTHMHRAFNIPLCSHQCGGSTETLYTPHTLTHTRKHGLIYCFQI